MHRDARALTSAGAGGAAAAGVGPEATGALLVTCAAEARTETTSRAPVHHQCVSQTSALLPNYSCMQATSPSLWSCAGLQGTHLCR